MRRALRCAETGADCMKIWERVLTGAIAAALLAAALFCVLDYRRANEALIENGICHSLSDLASAQRGALLGQLDAQAAYLGALTRALAGEAAPSGRVRDALPPNGQEAFERIGVADQTGLGAFSDASPIDLTQSPVLERAREGKTQLIGKEDASGKYSFALVAPVMADGRLNSLAVGVLRDDYITQILSAQLPSDQSYCFLSDDSGKVLAYSIHRDQLSIVGNALEFYGEAILHNGVTASRLREDLENGVSGVLSYSYGNQHRYSAYLPLGINGYFLFSVVPGAYAEAQSALSRGQIIVLAVRLAAILLLLIALCWWTQRRLVSALKDANREACRQERMRAACEDLSYTILFEVDPKTGALQVNDAFEHQLGRKIAIDNLYSDMASDDARALRKLAEEMKRGVPKSSASAQLMHQNGALIWYRVSYESLFLEGAAEPAAIMGRIANIERQSAEGEAPGVRAGSDQLTGLMGHRAFMEQAERMLPTLPPGSCLMLIDIDGFKEARDPKGRYDGEQLIVYLSESIRRAFGEGDLMGRLGGDTFAVLMPQASAKSAIERLAQAMCDVFKDVPVSFGQERPTCSVGIAQVSEDVDAIAELSRRADHALYHAKLSGKHCYKFYNDPKKETVEVVRGRANDATSVLLRCATALLAEPLAAAMDVLLSEVALYYQAERAYVLELDPSQSLIERYTWQARGVEPHEHGQGLNIANLPALADALKAHKPVVYTESETAAFGAVTDLAHGVLKAEGIHSVYLMPIGQNGKNIGFIGLDNPADHVGGVALLKSISQFIFGQLSKQ